MRISAAKTAATGRAPVAEPRRSAYVSAGVDVDAGEQAVELMRAAVESTRRPEVIGGLGGVGGGRADPPRFRGGGPGSWPGGGGAAERQPGAPRRVRARAAAPPRRVLGGRRR